MASKFEVETLKMVVAQICQNIGFQGIFSAPLEVLIDLLHRYLREIAVTTHRYTEHYGRTEPNLDDLGLAFQDLGISISDLEEYCTHVEPVGFVHKIPKIPVPKTSNLNFLKPGAREILSRPLYVHEHLPPMYPEKEEEEINISNGLEGEENPEAIAEESPISPSQGKRSIEGEVSPNKKLRINPEDEGEPVREIDSVMMTTSGYISSAREGKMPEPRRPSIPMSIPRGGSPVTKSPSSLIKIIRHKNHHGGILPGPLAKPKTKHCKLKPKIPLVPPGTGSFKRMRSPTGGQTPKLKIPNMSKEKDTVKKDVIKKDAVKKDTIKKDTIKKDKEPSKKEAVSTPSKKSSEKDGEKKRKKEKDKEGKEKRKKERVEGIPGEGGGESSKKKEERRESRKESSKGAKERTRIRMRGLSKEEELRRYKARENELIAALAASSAVTVTSIPPPSLRVREKTPEKSLPPSEAAGKNKLSVFRKFPMGGVKEGLERDSSPDLMIDDRIVKEEKPSPPPSPRDDFPLYPEEIPPPPPTPPFKPKIPDVSPRIPLICKGREKSPHKIKKEKTKTPKEKKSPKQKNSGEGKRRNFVPSFSPPWRSPPDMGTPERPKTPEVGGMNPPVDDLPGNSLFGLAPFPHGPSLIPPFTRFPFMPPFGAPPRPPLPDINPLSHMFIGAPHFSEKKGPDEVLDSGERPPTPSHDLGGNLKETPLLAPPPPQVPLPLPVPLPPPPLLKEPKMIPPPLEKPLPHPPKKAPNQESMSHNVKPEKADKEKKKEHKKEKKEKEKEKEKVKKKKDKKDKIKAKEEKKKEKERMKKERKKGKKNNSNTAGGVPKITLKLQSDDGDVGQAAPQENKSTPKLVIKPVVKPSPPEEFTQIIHSVEKIKRKKKVAPTPSPPSTSTATLKLSPQQSPGSPPEIAKFSALVTRPPKGSQTKKPTDLLTVPPLKIKDGGVKLSGKKDSNNASNIVKAEPKGITVPPIKIKSSTSTTRTSNKLSDEKKPPSKKSEKKEKKKTSPLIITSLANIEPMTHPPPPPIVSPPPQLPPPIPIPSEIPSSKGSKKCSANAGSGSTSGGQSSSSKGSSGLVTETVGPIGHFVDDQGNEVWICPTCGKQDDGSPMIGCDTCDDWYHWLCVDILVPPNERENWYCPRCVSQHKQQRGTMGMEKKKRGRKKKII